MMKAYGYVKDINDFSKGCVASGDTILCDVIGWTRFEAVAVPPDQRTGFMVVDSYYGRLRLCARSYSTVSAERAEQGFCTTGSAIGATSVKVTFGYGG